MVRTFSNDIYPKLMIAMCVRNHLIFCDDPLVPSGKDFGGVSRQNIIMIMYLSNSHAVIQCGEMDNSAR